MEWVIIILIVLAVLLAAALIWTAMKRKKNEVARQRAGELRSEAATSAVDKQEQEARAREAAAEAERARAQADKLDARAQAERTSYDQTRAVQEDRLREADRLDPDVNHRSNDYQPGADGAPGQHTETHGSHAQTQHTQAQPTQTQHTEGHGSQTQHTEGDGSHTQHTEGRGSQTHTQHPEHSTGEANPVPPGPETVAPEHTGSEEQDRLNWEREQQGRDQI